jgi:hypothetical protein
VSVHKQLPIPGTADVTVDIGNIVIHQLPVNSNIATTGHKLQEMSKLMMVVTEWGSFPNWIYVVLSRVTTRAGLFLLKPLTKRIESFVVFQRASGLHNVAAPSSMHKLFYNVKSANF